MSNIFNSVPISKVPRSTFNLSHEVKFSCNQGKLIPIICEEVLPGDNFRIKTEALVRFAPLLAPVMHRYNLRVEYFFVPNRLVWNEWETFITRGADGMQAPIMPQFHLPMDGVNIRSGDLSDYFGLPLGDGISLGNISALPYRAYQLIWNEYYRDQNLQAPIPINLSGGTLSKDEWGRMASLRNRCWQKDYFTSALPWTQRGPEVSIPLGTSAPVVLNNKAGNRQGVMIEMAGSPGRAPSSNTALETVNGNVVANYGSGDYSNSVFDPMGTLIVDLEDVSSVTINQLRVSASLQRWFENNARSGSRYNEQIRAHFGVTPKDSRLQRPEFLGATKSPVVVSEVLQTSASDTTSPQANMAGHAISAGLGGATTSTFTEHGYLIGLLSVMPTTAYQQGIPKKFLHLDNMDFAFHEFANLGEQAILNKELFVSGSNEDNGTFGYTPRYAEYKYCPSRVAGDFRTSLNFWHSGRIFASKPALNASFVSADPTTRIFAVQDEDSQKLWIQLYNSIHATRPLPRYGVPYRI